MINDLANCSSLMCTLTQAVCSKFWGTFILWAYCAPLLQIQSWGRLKPCPPGDQNLIQKMCEQTYYDSKGKILSIFLVSDTAPTLVHLVQFIASNLSRTASKKMAPWTCRRDSESLVVWQFSRMFSKQGNMFKLYKLGRNQNFTLKKSWNSISNRLVNCSYAKKSYSFFRSQFL